jgi:hypothetical protein
MQQALTPPPYVVAEVHCSAQLVKRSDAFKEGQLGVVADLLLARAEHEGMSWQLDGATEVMQHASAVPGPSTATAARAGGQAAAATRLHSAPQQTQTVIPVRQPLVS